MVSKLILALLLLVACSVLAASEAQPQSDAATLIARVESAQSPGKGEWDALALKDLMAQLRVPGLSIAVVKDFKLHWAKGYGLADAASGRLVDAETRFQAASLSKPVTALAAMRLVQEGRLRLDGDINTVLKSWKVPSSELTHQQPVTARSLLSHTSGANDGFGFPGYEPGVALPSVVQILEGQAPSNVGKVVFARAPYAAFKYSGGGTLIVQQALMDLCECAFEDLVQATVLTPLGMARSAYRQPLDDKNVALAHDPQGRRMPAPWHVYPELAAAALWTTPTDLAAFIVEIQTALRGPAGKVLSQRSATEMITPVGVGRFAVGLAVDPRGPGSRFSHNGSNWGYRAWMMGHASKGYGMVIMANGDNGMALLNQVADRVVNAYGWDAE